MDQSAHRIVGIYDSRASARFAGAQIVDLGLVADQISLLEGATTKVGADSDFESEKVLNDLLRDGAIGSAVGTAAGAGVSIALAAANLTLFIASPVLSTLFLLGWGASLGGLVGAAVGADGNTGDLPTLIKDALKAGHVVLVIHANTDDEAARARYIVSRFDAPGVGPSSRTQQMLATAAS